MENLKVMKKNRRYDENFKQEALKMLQTGRKASEVAQALGISDSLLHSWKSEHKSDLNPEQSALQIALDQSNARNRLLEQERDILKKALSIISRFA